ncbi:MAG: flagellar hook-length control protein FliK, partial [Nocardioidaceae bacterium]
GRATTDMATGAAGATQTGAASTPVPTVTGPPAPGRAAPDTPAPPSGSDVGAVGVVSGSPSGSDIGGRGEAGPGTVAATDRHAGAATDGAVPAPTAATQVLPGVGPATAATPTAPTAPTGSGPSPAVSQVVPAVTRLVSRGDGTNRLVLKLHPADLGEVQVTVTVRGRAVDVTLAAGPAARDALHQGSGQLRWLLDLTGHVTGQLVVRDLPSAPSTGSGPRLDLGTPSHPGSNGGNANDAGAPGGSTGDPQRDGRPARVPMTAATGGAPTTTPTTTPATRRTTAGALDLTI